MCFFHLLYKLQILKWPVLYAVLIFWIFNWNHLAGDLWPCISVMNIWVICNTDLECLFLTIHKNCPNLAAIGLVTASSWGVCVWAVEKKKKMGNYVQETVIRQIHLDLPSNQKYARKKIWSIHVVSQEIGHNKCLSSDFPKNTLRHKL